MHGISSDIQQSIHNDVAITPAKVMARTPASWRNLTVSQRIERAAAEARANGTYGKPTPAVTERKGVSH